MTEMNAFTVDDETVKKLEAAGFAPVLRWVRPFKGDKVYKTREALAAVPLTREEKDVKLGAEPLSKAKCDECGKRAFTRWYTGHGTKREKVAYTFCKKHNDAWQAESAANRKRLGLESATVLPSVAQKDGGE